MQKLPFLLVVGEKEKAVDKVAVRARGGEDLGQMSIEDFVARFRPEAHAGAAA